MTTHVRILVSRDVMRMNDRLTVRVSRDGRTLQKFVDLPTAAVEASVARGAFLILADYIDELEKQLAPPKPAPPADLPLPNEPGPEA